MKRYLGVAALVFVAVAGWRVGDSLSPDALSMAVGVLFGVMAGLPAALLVMASGRRREPAQHTQHSGRDHTQAYPMYPGHGLMSGYLPQQPPVIVVAGPQTMQPALGQGNAGANPGLNWEMASRPARSFKVVGEREEWIEEW